MKALIPVMVIAGLLVTPACATRGRAFEADSVVRIEPGWTTQEDIRRWFGAPVSVRTTAYGNARWKYVHEETTRRDTRTLTKIGRSIASILGSRVFVPPVDVAYENTTRHELTVVFGPDGIVEDYAYERRDVPARRVY